MTRIALQPENEAAWKGYRALDVTSTESAALFPAVGCPYVTAFELFHRKKDAVVVDLDIGERGDWGTDLQDAIAASLARRYGVDILRVTEYMRIKDARMGASFDFEIVGRYEPINGVQDRTLQHLFEAHGPGILEIKNVDRAVFAEKWLKVDEESKAKFIEPPGYIDIQLHHQLHVRERKWGAIGVLVGGNTGKLVTRLYDPAVGQGIENRIREFWRSIEVNEPPSPTWPKDAEFVASLYKTTSDRVFDGRGNADLEAALAEYVEAGKREKLAKEDKEVAKAKWLQIIGDAARGYSDKFTVSTWNVAEAPVSYTRPAYRGCRVTPKKGS